MIDFDRSEGRAFLDIGRPEGGVTSSSGTCLKCLATNVEHPFHDGGDWNPVDGPHWQPGGKYAGPSHT